jgi:hypothetical protein
MDTSVFQYLSRVLGVQHLNLLPFDNVAIVRNQNLQRPTFYVFTPFEMSNEERALADKMIKVLETENVSFIHSKNLSEFETTQGFGLSFGAAPQKMPNVKWFEMESISSFVNEANPSKLQQSKRQAWDILKNLKIEMKENANHRIEAN